MNFMSTFQFRGPQGGQYTNWGFDLDVLPHPIAFGALKSLGDDDTKETVPLLNTQLTGSTHLQKYATWKGYAQKWRMTYMGVTLYQDGAALTNQGTVQACQRPVEPMYLQNTQGTYVTGALTGGQLTRMSLAYHAGDNTDFDTIANMPNAYVGRSADGCYMPVIVTSTCQKWHGEHDEVSYHGIVGSESTGRYDMGASAGESWPLYGVNNGPYQTAGGTSVIPGETVCKMASNIWGLISARNLDSSTSFTVTIRSGWELQCQPGTLLTPQLHISPAYDPHALAAYFAIRRELKDAYPADYNDWAKIWGIIKKVSSYVLPGISMMGPIGAAAGAAGGGLVSVIDSITNAVSKKRPVEQGRNPMPLAEKDRAQELVKAASALNQIVGKGKIRQTRQSGQPPVREQRRLNVVRRS